METMEIRGRSYPVMGYVTSEELGTAPLVDIPMMSDYRWNMKALQSRLENPEMYREALGEDVEAVIAKLRRSLDGHREAVAV